MAKIERLKALQTALKRAQKKYGREPAVSFIVGYTANYALHVHESIEMKLKGQKRAKPGKGKYWDPQGRAQAKFLEQPARELKKTFQQIIKQAVANGATLEQSLLMVGLRLQRESQKIVPVDTGNLKASAFTRKEARPPQLPRLVKEPGILR